MGRAISRLEGVVLLVGVGLLFDSAASALVTRRCTKEFRLDGSGNDTPWPGPGYQLPGVSAQICLKVDSATGKVTQELEFKNYGTAAVEFLFCNMIELNAGKTTIINNCDLSCLPDGAGGQKWACDRAMASADFRLTEDAPGWHFGCEKVTIPARVNATTPSVSKPPAKMSDATVEQFKNKRAWEFEVSYADIFSLDAKSFNPADCNLKTCDLQGTACTTDANCDADRGHCAMSDPPPTGNPTHPRVFA